MYIHSIYTIYVYTYTHIHSIYVYTLYLLEYICILKKLIFLQYMHRVYMYILVYICIRVH